MQSLSFKDLLYQQKQNQNLVFLLSTFLISSKYHCMLIPTSLKNSFQCLYYGHFHPLNLYVWICDIQKHVKFLEAHPILKSHTVSKFSFNHVFFALENFRGESIMKYGFSIAVFLTICLQLLLTQTSSIVVCIPTVYRFLLFCHCNLMFLTFILECEIQLNSLCLNES